MASSKDFEKIWESYQEVVKTKDVSIVDYCQRNGIVYSQFQRWYKKHVSGVSIVPVSDPEIQQEPMEAASHRTCKDKSELCEYRVFQRIEGMPEIHKL